MNYSGITYPDVNNGWGCRVTLWVSGCPHHCLNCHNPQTWDYNAGQMFNSKVLDKLIELVQNDTIEGLTISGGDPLDPKNMPCVLSICMYVKKLTHKNIWVYTGYTYEYLCSNPIYHPIFQYIDVLVDGPYMQDKRDVTSNNAFRGSTNQRLIDVQKSNNSDTIVLWTQPTI